MISFNSILKKITWFLSVCACIDSASSQNKASSARGCGLEVEMLIPYPNLVEKFLLTSEYNVSFFYQENLFRQNNERDNIKALKDNICVGKKIIDNKTVTFIYDLCTDDSNEIDIKGFKLKGKPNSKMTHVPGARLHFPVGLLNKNVGEINKGVCPQELIIKKEFTITFNEATLQSDIVVTLKGKILNLKTGHTLYQMKPYEFEVREIANKSQRVNRR